MMTLEHISSIFHLLCVVSTLVLLWMCAWRYIENDSTSLVDFRIFQHQEKDIYPSFSLCFRGGGIFDKDNLNTKEIENYKQFLKGEIWDDEMLNIDYDEVTLNLVDYVEQVALQKNYGSPNYYEWNQNNSTRNESNSTMRNPIPKFPFYTSYRHEEMKCFSLDLLESNMPGIKENRVQNVLIQLKDINKLELVHLSYYMHYPGQLFRGVILAVEYERDQGVIQGNLASKNFWIDSVEIVRSRNTLSSPCVVNSIDDVNHITKSLTKNVKCKPPNWKDVEYPVCKEKNSMKKLNINEGFFNDPEFLANFTGPCNQMKTVTFTVQDIPRPENDLYKKDHAKIYLIFKSTAYKEILHVRAFDIESLVGNTGGYIGLFLGFAIWQLPDGIKIIVQLLEKL